MAAGRSPGWGGRAWAVGDVLGVAFDSKGQLWSQSKPALAARGRRAGGSTKVRTACLGTTLAVSARRGREVWFTTHLGVIRFDGKAWQYRQGRRWLPHDDVAQAAVDAQGTAWFATAAGIGCIERRPMTLAAKAEFYEQEIERYIKRSPFGYVAERHCAGRGTRPAQIPRIAITMDSGRHVRAGECFAYGATKDLKAKERAKKAFGALRFLQKVTRIAHTRRQRLYRAHHPPHRVAGPQCRPARRRPTGTTARPALESVRA